METRLFLLVQLHPCQIPYLCRMLNTNQVRPYLPAFFVATGVLLSTMDSSMVNVALPEMMRGFGVDVATIKQVMLVYLATITITLVFWGRYGDRVGKGRVYVAGMVVFAGGGLGCAMSGTITALLLARAVQGLGAAMMMANGPAIVRDVVPRSHLGRTLGAVGMATSLGLMGGPLVSGAILTFFSWRGVFLVGPPLALCASIIGGRYLLPGNGNLEQPVKQPFDWLGGFLWVAVVVLFVLLAEGARYWGAVSLGVFILLTAVATLFWRAEKRAVAPILPPALVTRRYYWTSVMTAAISFGALFIVLILLPFYLDLLLGYSGGKIGLAMMALPASLIVVSPASGWLYDRLGSARLLSTLGLGICFLAVAALLLLDEHSAFIDIFWRLSLLGAGQSIFLAPNSASVLSRVRDSYAGITSGVLATARNFGMLAGTAIAGAGFDLIYGRFAGSDVQFTQGTVLVVPFLTAFRCTLSVSLLLLLGGCLVSFSRGR